MSNTELFAELGIPPDYGRKPRRPRYGEAGELEEVEANIVGKMQRLAPQTARSWRQMKQAAALSGVQLLLVSGYRSIQQQTDLFRQKLAAGHDIDAILHRDAGLPAADRGIRAFACVRVAQRECSHLQLRNALRPRQRPGLRLRAVALVADPQPPAASDSGLRPLRRYPTATVVRGHSA
jgi:hypothetical protein